MEVVMRYTSAGSDGGRARGVRAAAGRLAAVRHVQDHVLPVVRHVRLHHARGLPAPRRRPVRLRAAQAPPEVPAPRLPPTNNLSFHVYRSPIHFHVSLANSDLIPDTDTPWTNFRRCWRN